MAPAAWPHPLFLRRQSRCAALERRLKSSMEKGMGWLSLKVSEKTPSRRQGVFISIPKKSVRLATQRNRIRRLVREAVRQSDRFNEKKVYHFMITNPNKPLHLTDVQSALQEALSKIQ